MSESSNVPPVEAQSAENVKNAQQVQQEGKLAPTGENQNISKMKIPTMESLRVLSPETYEKTLMGIATTIVNQMKRQQERMKRILRENR